jgi:hypothetical protein
MMRIGLDGGGIGPSAERKQHHAPSPLRHRIGDRKGYRPGAANDSKGVGRIPLPTLRRAPGRVGRGPVSQGFARGVAGYESHLAPLRFLLGAGAGATNRIRKRPRAAADKGENAADQPVVSTFSLKLRQPVAKHAAAEK